MNYNKKQQIKYSAEIARICSAYKIDKVPRIKFKRFRGLSTKGEINTYTKKITIYISPHSSVETNNSVLALELAHYLLIVYHKLENHSMAEIEEEAKGIADRFLWHKLLSHRD